MVFDKTPITDDLPEFDLTGMTTNIFTLDPAYHRLKPYREEILESSPATSLGINRVDAAPAFMKKHCLAFSIRNQFPAH